MLGNEGHVGYVAELLHLLFSPLPPPLTHSTPSKFTILTLPHSHETSLALRVLALSLNHSSL